MKIDIPAVAAAALVECEGKILRLDPADVQAVDIGIAVEPIKREPTPDGARRYEAGPQTVTITINMKPGARALWIDKEQDSGR